MSAEARLQELGIELPPPFEPVGNFVAARVSRGMLYVSGQGPAGPDGMITGKVGGSLTLSQGVDAARVVGLNLLAAAKAAAGGNLEKVEVLKVLGMVNAVPGFGDQPKVINGCSDLFVNVLGERGRHARSAVGMGSLPVGIPVEIEAVMRVVD